MDYVENENYDIGKNNMVLVLGLALALALALALVLVLVLGLLQDSDRRAQSTLLSCPPRNPLDENLIH